MSDCMTEPMTKEQYEHLTALFFSISRLDSIGLEHWALLYSDSYEKYLEACKYTKLKEIPPA